MRDSSIQIGASQNGAMNQAPHVTHRNLMEVKQDGHFYDNFYYKLNNNGWTNMIYVVIQVMEKPDQRIDTPVI
jgi:hypothetical protein